MNNREINKSEYMMNNSNMNSIQKYEYVINMKINKYKSRYKQINKYIKCICILFICT